MGGEETYHLSGTNNTKALYILHRLGLAFHLGGVVSASIDGSDRCAASRKRTENSSTKHFVSVGEWNGVERVLVVLQQPERGKFRGQAGSSALTVLVGQRI